MQFIQGSNRNQTYFATLEDQVSTDNAVRLMDAFVDKLDLQRLGFTNTIHKSEGRPPYAPAVLLKIYLYGYLNKIRSSRKLKKDKIAQGIAKLKERTIKYDTLQQQLNDTTDKQISATDPDSRSILIVKNIVEVAYNTRECSR